MNTETIIEQFDGNPVAFHAADAFVNATIMAAPYEKRPNDFLALTSTKEFIAALAEAKGVLPENLVTLIRGNFTDGSQQGTWLHPLLGVEFARWLNVRFAIWMNETILRVLAGRPVAAPALSNADESRVRGILDEIEAAIRAKRAGTLSNADASVLANLTCQYLKAWDVVLKLRAVPALPAKGAE